MLCASSGQMASRDKGTSTMVVIDVTFFFFQAEDGIRDVAVTGVQTYALPISSSSRSASRRSTRAGRGRRPSSPSSPASRSEERRVGKEGRLRRSLSYDNDIQLMP